MRSDPNRIEQPGTQVPEQEAGMMNSARGRRAAAVMVALVLASAGRAAVPGRPTLKEILRKNIEASGGKAKLGRVKSLSFRTGGTRHVVSAAGDLKVLVGKDPVVTEIIRVRGHKVESRSFDGTREITGPQKAVYATLAKVYAGAFSLMKFAGRLELEGAKSFGPETLYHLTAKGKNGSVATHFYLRADDFSLKRLVFQGTTPEGDKYEVNYDFAPFEEAEGLRLPLSWFVSQVGTRGNLAEVSEVKANQPLGAGFFSSMDLNMGSVKAGPGRLEGNVLDVTSSPNGLSVVTNWRRKDVDQAGFKSGDALSLRGGDQSAGFIGSVVFYASAGELPPPGDPGKDTGVLGPAPRGGETFVLQLRGPSAQSLAEHLKVLAPILVEKSE
jgi:hypothetical protein